MLHYGAFRWLTLVSYRELEQDLVPEWRAKYLDYKVRLNSVLPGLESVLTAYTIGRQEEGQGDYSCPSFGSSESSNSVFSSSYSFLPRRDIDAIQHRQAARCGRVYRFHGPQADRRPFVVEYSFHAEDRATAASNTRITILGNCRELWQYSCDSNTATWPRVGFCFIRASRPRTRSSGGVYATTGATRSPGCQNAVSRCNPTCYIS